MSHQMSNENKGPWLFRVSREWNTHSYMGIITKPLWGSLSNNQYNGKKCQQCAFYFWWAPQDEGQLAKKSGIFFGFWWRKLATHPPLKFHLPPKPTRDITIFFFGECIYQHLPKGCQLNPKGWLIDTLEEAFGTLWNVQVDSCFFHLSFSLLKNHAPQKSSY